MNGSMGFVQVVNVRNILTAILWPQFTTLKNFLALALKRYLRYLWLADHAGDSRELCICVQFMTSRKLNHAGIVFRTR